MRRISVAEKRRLGDDARDDFAGQRGKPLGTKFSHRNAETQKLHQTRLDGSFTSLIQHRRSFRNFLHSAFPSFCVRFLVPSLPFPNDVVAVLLELRLQFPVVPWNSSMQVDAAKPLTRSDLDALVDL